MPNLFHMLFRALLAHRSQAGRTTVWVLLLIGGQCLSAQDPGRDTKRKANPHPAFLQADAVRVLDQVRGSLESNNPTRFLRTFDAKRMPDYAGFRDQVAEFFARYDSFVVSYHLIQTTMDGEFGAALADFEFDARPRDGVTPNVHQRLTLRLVCRSEGTQWKIVDISPRGWLQ